MKWGGIVLLILVCGTAVDVASAKKGRDRNKGRDKAGRGRSGADPRAKGRSKIRKPIDDFFDSIIYRGDDTILFHIGDQWVDQFGNSYDGNGISSSLTTRQPAQVERDRSQGLPPLPYSQEWVRLRALRGFMNAGVVEVYRAGRWGLVCDDAWDNKDAGVVCRQLGFTQGAQGSPGEAYYGVDPNRWSDSDIIMDDVECVGSERSLQYCQYEDRHDCSVSEAASVVCRPNRGCVDGWISGGDSCYKFFGGAVNIKAAAAKCLSLNASLVSVESMQENHFLSNVLFLTATQQEHVWYTSGRLSKKTWRWSKSVPRSQKKRKGKGKKGKGKGGKKRSKGGKGGKRRNRKRPKRAAKRRWRNVRSPVEMSRWFPGWGDDSNKQEPISKKGHTCLVLTDLFPLPNGTQITVDYYYWRASRCRKKGGTINFICETSAQPQPQECYSGIGESYRGVIAHTERGTPCISWPLGGLNEQTHPGKGLGDHNFCRNPDGDQRPWCWVAPGKFGFCPIPQCSSTTTPGPQTTTTSMPPDTPNCPSDEFFCTKDNKCIPDLFRCDGEEDCDSGEDETDCEYASQKFEEYPGRLPDQALHNLTYANTPLETCARYCLMNSYFPCLSFVYNEDERHCQLLDSTNDTPVHLLPSDHHSYFILSSEAVNCTGKFRCNNGRCIDSEKLCNGRDDCGDSSDEIQCASQPPPMRVRLQDGEENSGRVEVHYLGEWGTVCDDNWDIQDAHVVCRMLGYPDAERASVVGEFGAGQGNIVLDEVECTGQEHSLQDCPAQPWRQHDCQAFEAAGVVCRVNKTCDSTQFTCGRSEVAQCVNAKFVCDGTPSCPDSSDESDCELNVELKNGTSPNEGRVELIRNGVRGTVCDDGWEQAEADVICHMLGYRFGGQPVKEAGFGAGTGVIWLDDLECGGREESLGDCGHGGWTVNDCSHLEDAGVKCHTSPPATTPVTRAPSTTPLPLSVLVHLMDGDSPNQGRVELEIGRYRGTICDDSFDDRDATVLCRMAGFELGGRAVQNGNYGPGSENLLILMDELACTGNETSVLECAYLQPIGTHNCRHSEDAGVFCFPAGGEGDEEGGAPTTSSSVSSTRPPSVSILGDTLCGLRPMEKLLRSKRQAEGGEGNGNSSAAELNPFRIEKIVGGDIVQHGMYPWQVGIQKIFNFYSNGDMLVSHWCGGTILNKHWILSAAHCFKDLPKSRIALKVGDHGQKVNDKGEQKFLVEELIPHSGYERSSHDYDIALLKVKSADGQGIKFNDYVQPACLPTSQDVYTRGARCFISGWGETGSDSEHPNILRAAEVPLLGGRVCGYLYKGALTPRMLCAGYVEGGIDTCQGDSGGPLVCNIDGVFSVLGVTSWGFGCANPNAPGIYTNTAYFLSWIEDTIRQHSP